MLRERCQQQQRVTVETLVLALFLNKALMLIVVHQKRKKSSKGLENGAKKLLNEAIFAVHENTQRNYTYAADLFNLDYAAESEYKCFQLRKSQLLKAT